jgi:hypothetical protein
MGLLLTADPDTCRIGCRADLLPHNGYRGHRVVSGDAYLASLVLHNRPDSQALQALADIPSVAAALDC